MDKTRLFWRASGAILVSAALFGYALRTSGNQNALVPWLTLDAPHDALHLGLGLAALILGFLPLAKPLSERIALGFGTAYLALGVLGFLSGNLFGYPARMGVRIHLDVVENMLHIALGAWGAYVGTGGGEPPEK